jgi:FkbM family methyltransferase
MSLSRQLDTLAKYVPDPVKPVLRPFYPLYRSALEQWFQFLPERTIETPWGIKIRVNPSNFVERRLAYGIFEAAVIEYVIENLTDVEQFVDIGANVGFYSILFAMHSDDESEVHAFEPLSRNLLRFEQNISENNVTSVNIHEVALSDRHGTVELQVSDKHPGESSLSANPVSSTRSRTVEVETKPFDDVTNRGIHPEVMKIDVEGAEYKVLDGARGYLSSHSPDLLLELHPERLRQFGDDVSDIQNLLSDVGYSDVQLVELDEEINVSEIDRLEEDELPHLHVT